MVVQNGRIECMFAAVLMAHRSVPDAGDINVKAWRQNGMDVRSIEVRKVSKEGFMGVC